MASDYRPWHEPECPARDPRQPVDTLRIDEAGSEPWPRNIVTVRFCTCPAYARPPHAKEDHHIKREDEMAEMLKDDNEQLALATMQAKLRDQWLTKPEQEARNAALRFELIDQIGKLTDEQVHTALHFLSGYDPHGVRAAVEFATTALKARRKR
jgi:hypothetical protein